MKVFTRLLALALVAGAASALYQRPGKNLVG